MARRVLGLTVLLSAATSLSPAWSASLISSGIRVSPALQFHSVSPNVQSSEKHALSDFHITKHFDKATPKLMMRTTPTPPTGPVAIPYPNSGAQQ